MVRFVARVTAAVVAASSVDGSGELQFGRYGVRGEGCCAADVVWVFSCRGRRLVNAIAEVTVCAVHPPDESLSALPLAAIGICPSAATSSCPETASFVTEGDDGLSADVAEPSARSTGVARLAQPERDGPAH